MFNPTSKMETTGINYFLAISFALIGWFLRVVWYYFKFDSDTEVFNHKKFWLVYDKYIITGFVGAVVLALVSDIIWAQWFDDWVGMDGALYDERANIALGFIVLLILAIFDRKAKDKFENGN